jgi:hypothetical protein
VQELIGALAFPLDDLQLLLDAAQMGGLPVMEALLLQRRADARREQHRLDGLNARPRPAVALRNPHIPSLATGTKLVSRRSCHKSSASSKAIYSSPNGSWSTPLRGSNSVPSAEARPSVSARLSMSAAQRKRLPAEAGYTKGVPMGGDLRDAPDGKAPTFLVAALKDPIGANLDRIQIIKGWLGQDGQTREKVYDVVWGDADEPSPALTASCRWSALRSMSPKPSGPTLSALPS